MDSVTQGTLVAERYRLIRAIGFGGMGTVWLAHDQVLDCPCAVKLIGATQARQEEFRIRFECEAKCAAQLRSPHVVDVLNRGQWQGKPFIVMEYMEGEDLGVRLERVGRLELHETYRIVAHVARALMRAHALGIVHRDIKPGNIFLAPSDEQEIAKILDFGVAKHRALPNAYEAHGETAFIGTPCYMSPEQARGEAVDWRSDLWALAVIIFECLTGDVPFQQEEIVEVVAAITRGPVPSLLERRPDLPASLEFWWRRATAKERELRFQSAKELADALADAAGITPRLHIADFPPAAAEAPTLFLPLGVSSRGGEPARRGFAARASYESDAGVTIYSDAPTPQELAAFLPGYGRKRRSTYVLGATALCATLAFAVSSLRGPFADSMSLLGLDEPAKGMNVQPAAMIAGSPPARTSELPSVPSSASSDAVLAATNRGALATATSPQVAEPVVVVTEAAAAAANTRATTVQPASKPPVAVAVRSRPTRAFRPLAPPAPPLPAVPRAIELPEDVKAVPPLPTEPPAFEETKDYGI